MFGILHRHGAIPIPVQELHQRPMRERLLKILVERLQVWEPTRLLTMLSTSSSPVTGLHNWVRHCLPIIRSQVH